MSTLGQTTPSQDITSLFIGNTKGYNLLLIYKGNILIYSLSGPELHQGSRAHPLRMYYDNLRFLGLRSEPRPPSPLPFSRLLNGLCCSFRAPDLRLDEVIPTYSPPFRIPCKRKRHHLDTASLSVPRKSLPQQRWKRKQGAKWKLPLELDKSSSFRLHSTVLAL